MKQKLLSKYLIAGIIALSMFSFAYVNLHAVYSRNPSCEKQIQKVEPVQIEEENDKAQDLPIPDITIISRAVHIVQRFTSTNR